MFSSNDHIFALIIRIKNNLWLLKIFFLFKKKVKKKTILNYKNQIDSYYIKPRIKISVNTDISVIGFYGNIGNIGKYRWKFLQKYRFD